MGYFNKLTPAEAERLSIMAEECAEVIQIIGKIQRHGFDSCHPNGGPNNRRLLAKEIGDVKVATLLLLDSHDVEDDAVQDSYREKMFNIPQYLHHNKHMFPDYHYKKEVNGAKVRCCGDCDMPVIECDCN